MPRSRRIEFPGACYHVMSRGNNHQDIVTDDADRRRFIWRLGECADRFELKILAFCLMNNHYHLFLRTPRPNLGQAMHWLVGVYTQGFNFHHDRDGHLFRGRYHSVLVEGQDHWRRLSAYIHLNPVRAGLASDPGDWEWSSFRDYTSPHSRFGWLDPQPVLALLGPTPAIRQRLYRQSILALIGKPNSFWDEIRSSKFLGPEERPDELLKKSQPSATTTKLRALVPGLHPPVNIEEEVAKVAESLGLRPEQLTAGRRNLFRPAAYHHLVKNCGLTGAQVAKYFGVSETAVSLGIRSRSLVVVGSGLKYKL